MRVYLSCLVVLLVAVASGCTNSRWGFLNREKSDEPTPSGTPPTKEALVSYLNENAGRIQTVRADDLDITVYDGLVPFSLRGKLMTQKPHGFRMSGDALGNRVVDLGSNDQEFWWWISKDRPPNQYFCSYKDLSEGRISYLPFPFQPEWIMETMGLGPYGPAEKYELEPQGDTLRLVERTKSPQGKAVRKVIVMKRRPQINPRDKYSNPQVTEFLLVDDTSGNEICSAHISQVQVDSATGAVVPRKLELRWPAMKIRLAMKFDGTSVNTQLPQTAFVRESMPGIRSVDLAQLGQASPTNLQRVQGLVSP